jgi:hydroxypyruvate reductase
MIQELSTSLVSGRGEQAITSFREGVDAVGTERAVALALHDRQTELKLAKRVILISFGLAACPMARAALPFVVGKLHRTCVVTNCENLSAVEGMDITVAGFPLPDERSVAAAYAIERIARSAEPGDLLLVLISRGGSSLVCAPASGISLTDKRTLIDALLHTGADAREINAVRQQFSRLKGGRLAQITTGARVLSLILSDAQCDDIGAIASGPTAKPATTAADALAVLIHYRLGEVLPGAVRSYANHLLERAEEMDFSHVENVAIGSIDASARPVIDGSNVV